MVGDCNIVGAELAFFGSCFLLKNDEYMKYRLEPLTCRDDGFGARMSRSHARDVTQGLEIVGNRPHHFSNNNMVYSKLFKKKVYRRERVPTKRKKRSASLFQTTFIIFSQALSNRMYISSLKAVSLYCRMNCWTPASCLFLMRFNTICMAS